MLIAQATDHLFLIHDGAKYHTSQATQQFFAAHRKRITAHRLPSYSPDYNPIEYLWKKTKQWGTHNKYFKEFGANTALVKEADVAVLDGELVIEFVHQVQNPSVRALEIVKL